jgi:hypothetical protein
MSLEEKCKVMTERPIVLSILWDVFYAPGHFVIYQMD